MVWLIWNEIYLIDRLVHEICYVFGWPEMKWNPFYICLQIYEMNLEVTYEIWSKYSFIDYCN